MNKNYKQLFRMFCSETNILGLKYFYLYTDPFSRCFWLVSVISVTSLTCFLSYLLYVRYFERPTSIILENQYASAEALAFPSIVVCSPNQITIQALEILNKSLIIGNRRIDLKKVLPQLLGYYKDILSNEYNQNDVTELSNLIEMNRYHIPEILGMLPQRCEDFLKLCVYKNEFYYRCHQLFRPVLTNIGLCCAFNNMYEFKGNKKNMKRDIDYSTLETVGLNGAITIVTDFEPDSAVKDTIVDGGATRVKVMQPTDFPELETAKLIPSNLESFNFIYPTHTYPSEDVEVLPMSSRNCYLKNEGPVSYFDVYSKSKCDLLCEVNEIIRKCNCVVPYIPNVKFDVVCNATSIKCINDVKYHYSEWLNEENCKCTRDCWSFEFRVEETIGNLLSLEHMATEYLDLSQYKETSSILHFNIPRLVYLKQKQETVMSFITLCSNLGGVFGLCMGCSFISLFEIVFYIYIAIRNMIKNKRNRRSRKGIHPYLFNKNSQR